MPLNFVEEERSKDATQFFKIDSKARPLQLEGEVLPELIKKVGDVKSGRIAKWMVEEFLAKHVLVFDKDLLNSLFEEADFRNEGSLDERALSAALLGRYPKRKLTKEWRQLIALLLGMPELVLQEDIKNPKLSKNGNFNADSVWNETMPALPTITCKRVKSAEAMGEWKSLSGTASSLQQTGSIGSDAAIRTTGGIKSLTPIAAEMTINHSMQEDVPRCTFRDVSEFHTFTRGLEVIPKLGVDTLGSTGRSTPGPVSCTLNHANLDGSMTPASRAWNAALPRACITMHTSALQTLRSSVRSTVPRKPAFQTMHMPLTSAETDLKKVLGEELDVTCSLARVEPLRPTNTPYKADYVQWADYASNCRTAPTRWYNEHPSMEAKPPSKYPWGTST